MAFEVISKNLKKFFDKNNNNISNASGIVRGSGCYFVIFQGSLIRNKFFATYKAAYCFLQKQKQGA